MNEHGYCPHCQADLDGGDIPEDMRHHYSGTKWGRATGIEVRGAYDGILIWRCPDCNKHWPRFPKGGRLHAMALDIIKSWNEVSNEACC